MKTLVQWKVWDLKITSILTLFHLWTLSTPSSDEYISLVNKDSVLKFYLVCLRNWNDFMNSARVCIVEMSYLEGLLRSMRSYNVIFFLHLKDTLESAIMISFPTAIHTKLLSSAIFWAQYCWWIWNLKVFWRAYQKGNNKVEKITVQKVSYLSIPNWNESKSVSHPNHPCVLKDNHACDWMRVDEWHCYLLLVLVIFKLFTHKQSMWHTLVDATCISEPKAIQTHPIFSTWTMGIFLEWDVPEGERRICWITRVVWRNLSQKKIFRTFTYLFLKNQQSIRCSNPDLISSLQHWGRRFADVFGWFPY